MAVMTNAFIVSFSSNWATGFLEQYVEVSNETELLAGRLVMVIIFEVTIPIFISFSFFPKRGKEEKEKERKKTDPNKSKKAPCNRIENSICLLDS